MASTFPKLSMITSYGHARSVAATGAVGGVPDSVYYDGEEGVFNPMAKIEVEAAKTGSRYVHIRFSHTNKYWSRNNAQDGFVVAVSTEPEEDISKPSCTLFEPTIADGDGAFRLIHVQSGMRVILDGSPQRFLVSNKSSPLDTFMSINWETIVRLPRHVAFKSDNAKYLKAYSQEGRAYLQFSSDDPNDQLSGHEVVLMPNGQVRIKSDYWGRFWRRSPNWIWADSEDNTANNNDTLFWPVRVDDNTVALRNAGNDHFCKRLTTEGKTNCLNAGVPTITNEARLIVQELVTERRIDNIRFHFDQARIFDEVPFIAGTQTVRNNSNGEASQSVTIGYQDSKSYTFSRGFTTTAGVSTTISAGVPFFADTEFTVSFEISRELQWGQSTTVTQSASGTGTVPVPPNSTVVIKYTGTRGYCSIPYSYSQRDTRSTNGQIVSTEQVDGIYTGVSYYNFEFVIDQVQPL